MVGCAPIVSLTAVFRRCSSPRRVALALLCALGCLNPLPEEYPSEDSAPERRSGSAPPDAQSAESVPVNASDPAPVDGNVLSPAPEPAAPDLDVAAADAGSDAGVADAGVFDAGEPPAAD
jgi:hypothetical protein